MVPYLVSAGPNDTYLISIDLTGMVFTDYYHAHPTGLTRQDGGLAGDNYVLMRNAPATAITSTAIDGTP